jgi:hypothetical protein
MDGTPDGAARVRVTRTGIALVHEGETIGPAAGSEALLEGLDDQAVVYYHFPVEIEVLQPVETADAETVAELALRRLADGLEA